MHISNIFVVVCNIQIVIRMLKIQIPVLQVWIRGYLMVKWDLVYKPPVQIGGTQFVFIWATPFWGLTLGLLNKFTFSRSKVSEELLSNFQNFNFKKFVLIVKMIASYYIIYTNHFDRSCIKGTICEINNFSIVTSSLNRIVHNSEVQKTVAKKFSLSKRKIEKGQFFTEGPTKIFALAF